MSSGIGYYITTHPSGIRLGVYTIGNSTVGASVGGRENQDNDLITGNQRKEKNKQIVIMIEVGTVLVNANDKCK
jgi:hypothetical protein